MAVILKIWIEVLLLNRKVSWLETCLVIRWAIQCPTGDQEVAGFTHRGRQHSFMEIDHGMFSTVILSHLIQEGQLLVSGEILVNRSEH